MDDVKYEFHVRKSDARFGYDLRVFAAGDNCYWNAEPLVLTQHDPGAFTSPCAHLDEHQAQQLMDALWDCGIRPTSGEGSVGQIGALRDHKEDLRALVFEHLLPHLNLEKPE